MIVTPAQVIIFSIDVLLVLMAFWMVLALKDAGGQWGRALHLMSWSIILLGVSHFVETVTIIHFQVNFDLVEILHRTLILLCFALFLLGVKRINGTMR